YGTDFPSIADAKREVFQQLEMFYNRKRIYSALSCLPPMELLQVTKNPKLDV
ncbi:MAG: IS3 family transposase, partial [Spirochaetae bacterium HGW-Spirochaetae-2]